MQYPQRIQFETNIDERVDVNVRQWSRTKAAKLERRRGIVKSAVAATMSAFTVVLLMSGPERNAVVPSLIVALVLGAVMWPFYGRLYDGGLQRRVRRAMTEEYGQSPSWTCEIELRREGAWVGNFGVEMLFPWSETIAIADVAGAIEQPFREGLVVARDKAFTTVDGRREFFEAARELSKS